MSKKYPSPCHSPGCAEITTETYCPAHAKQYEQQRGTPTERGYDYRWQVFRKHWLANNPLCEHCCSAGKTQLATVVDHIIDHKGDMELFWREGNHQSLCVSCHNRKTAKTHRAGGGG